MPIKDYSPQLTELDVMAQPNDTLDQMVAEYLFDYHCPNKAKYSSDRLHIEQIENAIENLGIGNRYADELIKLIDPNTGGVYPSAIECNGNGLDAYQVILRVLKATPYERCIAALKAYFKSDGGNKAYEGW